MFDWLQCLNDHDFTNLDHYSKEEEGNEEDDIKKDVNDDVKEESQGEKDLKKSEKV